MTQTQALKIFERLEGGRYECPPWPPKIRKAAYLVVHNKSHMPQCVRDWALYVTTGKAMTV
jgi:hypothetical protein